MGAFYQSVHVQESTQQERAVLAGVCSKNGPQAWIGPTLAGWTTFFPDEMNGPALAQQVSAQLRVAALLTLVHDSDMAGFILFVDGQPVEQFMSPADAMGEGATAPQPIPERILTLASDESRRTELRALLASEPPDFAEERMADVLRLLGIQNGLSSYDYLERGERDAVIGWQQFTHLPDRKAETERRKAEKQARLAAKKAQRDRGLLLFDSELMRKPKLPSKFRLRVYGSAVKSAAYIVGGFEPGMALARWNPPEQPVPFSDAVATIRPAGVLGTLGRTIAVTSGSGIDLIDMSTGALVKQLVSANGSALVHDEVRGLVYLFANGALLALGTETDEIVFKTETTSHVTRATLHPTERHLLWHGQCVVGIHDAATGKPLATLAARNANLREKKAAQWSSRAGYVPDEASGALEREDILTLAFDPTGERVFAGTTEGLREYRYVELLHAREQLPVPVGGVETSVELQDYRSVASVVVDAARSRVLYSPGDDSISWYDWDRRTTGVLKPGTEGRRIWSLQLSGDSSKLLCRLGPGAADMLRRQDDHWVQVWDYEKLWSATAP